MTSRFLERANSRLHYEVHGRPSDQMPLLLTHGFAAKRKMWRDNLPALSADRQVITWDMRGHGLTQTEPNPSNYSQANCVMDMAAILDECGASTAIVGGLSLGGFLSLLFRLTYPDRVAALLLFDTGPGYHNPRGRERWNAYANAKADGFDRDGVTSLSDSPEVHRGVQHPEDLALAARHILTQESDDVINSLTSISSPTLIVVGERDTPFLPAADYMEAAIRDSIKVIVPGAGHASNIDRAETFDSVVLEFLKAWGLPMPEAVIVATARTPIGRAGKGTLTQMRPDDLSALILTAVLDKVPELDPFCVEDVIWGSAQPGGEAGYNIGRAAGILAGLDIPGMTLNRKCASSLQSIRIAAHAIKAGEGDVFVAGGVETVSRYRHGRADTGPPNPRFDEARERSTKRAEGHEPVWTLPEDLPDYYIAMGQTAENVRELKGVSRQAMDEFALLSHERAVHSQTSGFFAEEITPVERPDGTSIDLDDCPRPNGPRTPRGARSLLQTGR